MGQARSRNKQSLESMNLSTRVTPYKTEVARQMKPHLIDVPGIKKETELDSALALGVCSCLVICVIGDARVFSDTCHGDALSSLKILYENLAASHPPILLAVARPSPSVIHN